MDHIDLVQAVTTMQPALQDIREQGRSNARWTHVMTGVVLMMGLALCAVLVILLKILVALERMGIEVVAR